jgi:hypothetical protein
MPQLKGLNKHQKAARRPGEKRVSREDVEELLELSRSNEAEDRLIAASLLCPCHVRGRLPEVWEALYRMMEDEHPKVRWAAWHTLEDGGLPKDEPTLARLGQILAKERDPKVRRFAGTIVGGELKSRQEQEHKKRELLASAAHQQRGRCDFCGETGVPVERDLETPIVSGGHTRPALICRRCARNG